MTFRETTIFGQFNTAQVGYLSVCMTN